MVSDMGSEVVPAAGVVVVASDGLVVLVPVESPLHAAIRAIAVTMTMMLLTHRSFRVRGRAA